MGSGWVTEPEVKIQSRYMEIELSVQNHFPLNFEAVSPLSFNSWLKKIFYCLILVLLDLLYILICFTFNFLIFIFASLNCTCVLVTQSCPTLCDPWIVVCQAPLSMQFSRQEYSNEQPCPSPNGIPIYIKWCIYNGVCIMVCVYNGVCIMVCV